MHTGHWLNLTDREETSLATHVTLLGATCLIMVPVMSVILILGLLSR